MHGKLKSIFLLSMLIPLTLMLPPVQAEGNGAPDSMLMQRIESARGYMQAGQWDYAGYEWRAALAQNPDSLNANIGLAETLMQSGFPQEAARHLEQVRQRLHRLLLDLTYAKALEQAGDFMTAERVYLTILQIMPLQPDAFRKLIEIRPRLTDAESAALQAFLKKTAVEASQKGNAALKDKKYAEAVQAFAVSTQYLESKADLNNYGTSLLLLGRYGEALRQYDLLRKAQPDQWELYANSAFAALGLGKTAEAASRMEKAISLCADPVKKPLLYNDLGFIYESQAKWQKAQSAYGHAIELNPGFTKAMLNLAYAYQKDMAYENAIRIYHDIATREPGNINVLNRLGFVCELAHQDRQALNAYRKATERDPQALDAYYNQVLLYRKLGKTKQADQEYRKVMAIEFHQMEAAKAAPSAKVRLSEESREAGARLLDYADVFFAEPG